MIPKEFHTRAKELGYGDGCGWAIIEEAWDQWERDVVKFAGEQGMTVKLDGHRVWGYRDGETYLLAAATDPGDDPMNLWAQAFSRIDCYLRKEPLYDLVWVEKTNALLDRADALILKYGT